MAVITDARELSEQVADGDDALPMERLVALGSIPSGMLAECTCPEWCEHDHDNE